MFLATKCLNEYLKEKEENKKNFKVLSFPSGKGEEMLINIKGVSVSPTKRKDGRYQGYYSDGKQKQYVYGRTIPELEEKIRKVMKTGIKVKHKVMNGVPLDFNAFAMYYFENFRKRKVTPATYRGDFNRYNNYIKLYFNKRNIRNITPADCQSLIDDISAQGKGKTADEVFSLLSVIFGAGIKHGILQRSPLDIVYHERHERKNGKVLTLEIVKKLQKRLISHPFAPVYMIALFTGLRPNELKTIKIENDFIISVNSKRKNGKVEYKKIPIMRELRPYLDKPFKIPPYERLRVEFKALMPEYSLKDLRKTFNSRCIECGINEIVRKLWMGHSLGELGKAYTELSDEFMLKETQKFYFFAPI